MSDKQPEALRLAEPVGVVRQFRKMRCADWYDGLPDHEDGGGPYETRTLYTRPPARVPLTDENIAPVRKYLAGHGIYLSNETIKALIEAAHDIGGGK